MGGDAESGIPVIFKNAVRPSSVRRYFAGFPKKSTLNSTKPKAVSCLTVQSVFHSELHLIASSSSALLIPSSLLARAAIAAFMCGEVATFSNVSC